MSLYFREEREALIELFNKKDNIEEYEEVKIFLKEIRLRLF
jgi:hypothetical protein